MSKTGVVGGLCNNIIRGLSLSILAEKNNLYVSDYGKYYNK